MPKGDVADSAEKAFMSAQRMPGKVVIKAQVQIGGRGKAGGIKLADNPEQAREHAEAILGMDIKGHTVERVLVEQASEIAEEFYAAVMLDRSSKRNLVMVSSRGGVDIEEVAANEPDAIEKVLVDPLIGLRGYQINRLIFGSGIPTKAHKGVRSILGKLYKLFEEADASLVEVNPLILTADGDVIALDSKVSLDESALFRHADFEGFREVVAIDPQEKQAKERGLNFIKLSGDVGIIGNGAGLVMATLDVVDQAGGKPANFLDVGGGAGAEVLSSALEVVASGDVRSVLINIFGGITRCDEVAKGVVDALGRLDVQVPIVVRLDGTNAQEGRAILADANHPRVVPAETMSEAARKAVEAA